MRRYGPASAAILASAALAAGTTVLAGAGPTAAAARPAAAHRVSADAGRAAGSSPPGTITTLAGGTGGPAAATAVNLGVSTPIADTANSPCGVSFGQGQLFVADNWAVRSISPASGRLTTPAGTAAIGPFQDGGPATTTSVDTCAVAVDTAGNLVIADVANDRIRVAAESTGIFYGQQMTAGDIYTVAGTGSYGYSGDGGPATSAELSDPAGVAVDGSGNLVLASTFANRIRAVAERTGTFYGQQMTAGDIYTIAGTGTAGYAGDGGPATGAQLNNPAGVATDSAGNLLIADTGNNVIRVIAARTDTFYGQQMTAGDIYTIAGTGTAGYAGDGGPATGAQLNNPAGVATDSAGNLLIADSDNNAVRVVAGGTGSFYGRQMTAGDIYTIAGTGTAGDNGDGGPAASAELNNPQAVTIDGSGNVAVADTGNYQVRVIAAGTGTFYGQEMAAGDIYTVAGGNPKGLIGDGGAASASRLSLPYGIAVDADGNVVVADTGDDRIRVVAGGTGSFYGQQMKAGHIYTIAGTGVPGFSGEGGRAVAAKIKGADGVAVTAAGNLVLADTGNNRIRVVAEATGTFYGQRMTAGDIYTIAGTGTAGYAGDGGPATSAKLDAPVSAAVDAAGNLVIADSGNNRVRVVAASTGSYYGQQMTAGDIYTMAGTGALGFSGDGGPAASAGLAVPDSVAVDAAGNLVIADYGDNRVRVVAAGSGSYYGQQMTAGDIYTIAGTGTPGFSGDGGPAASATLYYPQGVAADGSGDVLVTDSGNNRLRMITGGSGSGAPAASHAAGAGHAAARARAAAHAPRPGRAGPSSAGPFVTLLFSRSEISAADGCVPDEAGIAPLDTVVAPYLHSLGMAGTGTLVTGVTQATVRTCTHYGDSLTSSWADAASLATNFGWSFVSHTATYPSQLSMLTPTLAYAETCGSAATLVANGLPGGHGLIAYPGVQALPGALQSEYGANCFAWGRTYNQSGTTQASAGTTPPYWQDTVAANGGACHVQTASCYHVTTIEGGHELHYTLPSTIIAKIQALQPGQWFTLQAYILVTGSSPSYADNADQWDCTSSNPELHWTNDNERYCYSDWQQIVNAIAAMPGITVTDPLTAGVAFGRPATYP